MPTPSNLEYMTVVQMDAQRTQITTCKILIGRLTHVRGELMATRFALDSFLTECAAQRLDHTVQMFLNWEEEITREVAKLEAGRSR